MPCDKYCSVGVLAFFSIVTENVKENYGIVIGMSKKVVVFFLHYLVEQVRYNDSVPKCHELVFHSLWGNSPPPPSLVVVIEHTIQGYTACLTSTQT